MLRKMEIQRSTLLLCTLIATLVVPFPGCEPATVEQTRVQQVHGKVLLDGKPVECAVVVFIPMNLHCKSGQPLPISFGITDHNGEFKLAQSADRDGAQVGMHQVLISKADCFDCGPHSQYDSLQDAKRVSKFGAIVIEALKPLTKAHCKADQQASMAICGCGLAQPKSEEIPSIYNCNSILRCQVPARDSVAKPRFNLTTVDPLLAPAAQPLVGTWNDSLTPTSYAQHQRP